MFGLNAFLFEILLLFFTFFNIIIYNIRMLIGASKKIKKQQRFVRFSKHKKRYQTQKSKPLWVRRQTLKLKETYPHLGCRQLAALFNRRFEHANMTISKSWVNALLIKHRKEALFARMKFKNKLPKTILKNNTWALDTTQLGVENQVLGIIDHGTRFCVCLRQIANINAWTILGNLFLAIGKYGKPKILRSDNHPVFHSFIWYWILTLANIKTKHSAPHSPWQNGRIESVFALL